MIALKKFRLGFIGGCLTHQPGVPYPRLFHRVLARRLEDEFGVRLEVVVSDHYGDEPRLRLASLLQEGPLDAVLLHRSSNTFFIKTAFVFVVETVDAIRYVLNPMVPRIRSQPWLKFEQTGFRDCITLWKKPRPPGSTAPPVAEVPLAELEATMTAAESGRFRLKDLSWIAGDRCGLVNWAIRDELRIVDEVHSAAAQPGLPLIVLGPGLNIGRSWVNRFAARLDAAFAAKIDQLEGGSYASLLAADPDSLSPGPLLVEHHMDRTHFNAAGHAFVADRLHPRLAPLLSQRFPACQPPSLR